MVGGVLISFVIGVGVGAMSRSSPTPDPPKDCSPVFAAIARMKDRISSDDVGERRINARAIVNIALDNPECFSGESLAIYKAYLDEFNHSPRG